jgi:hypothetical protein
MSFDPRSRERLEALGRQLPQKLPAPGSNTASPSNRAPSNRAPASSSGSVGVERDGSERRHRVETEQDPERLFRELMNVSPDGTVPPHLLERLKQLEGGRRPAPAAAANRRGERRPGGGARPTSTHGEQDLYTVFQQLLLEDEEADSANAPVREY